MDFKLELVILPVTDIDRAKDFYQDKAGFGLDVDHRAGEDFRIVQFTPPGSACSITLMRNEAAAGSVQGLHLVVTDIEAARAELAGRGAEVSDFFHFGAAGQQPGLHPERGAYESFFSFADPDGNGWMVQERPAILKSRATFYPSGASDTRTKAAEARYRALRPVTPCHRRVTQRTGRGNDPK